jgi:hypothetical protein
MANSYPELGKFFLKEESSYGVVPTLAGGDAFAAIECSPAPDRQTVQPPDKNGSFSNLVGTQDVETANVTIRASLRPSGTAGTAPDLGPLMKASLGAETVTAGTRVRYSCSNATPSVVVAVYDHPTTMDQELAFGVVPTEMRIDLDGQYPLVTWNCVAKKVLRKDSFAATATEGRGGLSSFPAEPSSPTYSGAPPRRGDGSVLIDGRTFCDIRQLSFVLRTGRDADAPGYCGGGLIAGIVARKRLAAIDRLIMVDDDSADMQAIKAAAESATPVTVLINLGTVAGRKCIIRMRNCVLPQPSYDRSGDKRLVIFSNITAAASGTTLNDELEIDFE